jgi:hypothetical protein
MELVRPHQFPPQLVIVEVLRFRHGRTHTQKRAETIHVL